ncbi:MAG TPA: hypothetical protein VL001_13480 [Candidimonas sp.]|nr:hypothetical protein [Candidimonas sp.]
MMAGPQLEMIGTRLREKMVARLALRWKKANAYIPPASVKVHCAKPLPDADQAGFDMYVLAYQDAIEDMLDMLDRSTDKAERPLALAMAENSVFQGGTLPRALRPYKRDGANRGHAGGKTSAHRDPEARRRLEDLFSGGRNG